MSHGSHVRKQAATMRTWGFVVLLFTLMCFSLCRSRKHPISKLKRKIQQNTQLDDRGHFHNAIFKKDQAGDSKHDIFGAHVLQVEPPQKRANVMGYLWHKRETTNNNKDQPNLSKSYMDLPFSNDSCYSKYCYIAKEILKQREQRSLDDEKITASLLSKTELFKVFSDMLQYGKLPEKSEPVEYPRYPTYRKFKNNFWEEAREGSAFVIENCQQSIVFAETKKDNIVISNFLDEESATQCQQMILRKKLKNIFLSVVNIKQILELSSMDESSSTNFPESWKIGKGGDFKSFFKITFDYVIISEKGKLSEGLLPHEFELLLSQLLRISNQTIITLNLPSRQNKIFKSVWSKPSVLVSLVCGRLSHMKCQVETKEGFHNDWQPITFNVKLTTNVSGENIAQTRGLGIPLPFFLSINLTKVSQDGLFMLLIQSRKEFMNTSDVFIKGHQVLWIQSEEKQVEMLKEQVTTSTFFVDSHKSTPEKHYSSQFLQVNETALKANKADYSIKDDDKVRNNEIMIDLLKNFAKDKQFPERFEAHWNREEKGGLKNIENFEITKRKVSGTETVGNEPFNIVDGRPVEEGKSLTEGYTYLSTEMGHNAAPELQVTNVAFRKMGNAASRIHKAYKGQRATGALESNYQRKTNLKDMNRNIRQKRKKGRQQVANLSHDSNLQHETVNKSESQKGREVSLIYIEDATKMAESDSISKTNQKRENNLDTFQFNKRRGRNLLLLQPTDTPSLMYKKRSQLFGDNAGDAAKKVQHLLLKYSQSRDFGHPSTTSQPLQSDDNDDDNDGPPRDVSNSIKIQTSPDPSDESVYDHVRDIILPRIQTIFQEKQALSALISGGCPFSMLSAKIAMLYTNISFITLNSVNSSACSDDLRYMLENNFHFHEDLDPDIVYRTVYTPQMFDFQIVSSNIFSWFLQMGEDFKAYLAHILSLSKVTFIEVPNWKHLVSTANVFNLDKVNEWEKFEDLLSETFFSNSVQVGVSKVSDISTMPWKSLKGSSIFMVEMSFIKRKVYESCTGLSQGPSIFIYENSKSVVKHDGDQSFPQKGLNLKLLLFLNLNPTQRKNIFSSYLQLNKHPEMCPLKLYWTQGKLLHQDDDSSVDSQFFKLEELVWNLNQDIHQNSFSFMDYNSPNKQVGTHLAQLHPNSTFLLAHTSMAEASRQHDKIKDQHLENVIPLDLPLASDFSKHLLESPDILRYQYFDFVSMLQTFHSDDVDGKIILGQILASGLTTFIIVPSAEILSLAMTTLYPGVFTSPSMDIAAFFKNAEHVLLMQSAKANVNIQFHTTMHPAISASGPGEGFQFPWRLATVRIMKMKLQVDHHFNFKLDGHQRKYTQHVERKESSTQPVVYLLREEDDYRINYGDVNAISLIALLRMGLLPSMKEEFYGKFLELPLYEDMAPWNIVFRAGQLEYIDQDTRDKIFEKFTPVAYQVMSALLNYERTVADFGHCNGAARNSYNIGQISSCVLSAFTGPCPDSRFPVPCGDRSCKSSYIECLRALNKKMTNLKDPDELLIRTENQMQGQDLTETKIWGFKRKQVL